MVLFMVQMEGFGEGVIISTCLSCRVEAHCGVLLAVSSCMCCGVFCSNVFRILHFDARHLVVSSDVILTDE